jgi:hypothetical protein
MAPEFTTDPQLTPPKALLAEVQRHLHGRRGDFHVEGWKKRSLVARMFGFLDRDRSRE